MLIPLRERNRQFSFVAVLLAVLVLASVLGQHASLLSFGLLTAVLCGLALLTQPGLGLFILVFAALLVPLDINTGTDVQINPVTLLIPSLVLVWLIDRVRRHDIFIVSSPVNSPLTLFLAASLLSLLIGRATWDAFVPTKSNFVLVQMAQWAIFAFSALAFWLAANLATDEKTLWRLTAFFLLLAGSAAIVRILPGLDGVANRVTTIAFVRAPLWVLLTALAGGQLLWNRRLSRRWRVFLGLVLLAAIFYAFFVEREVVSIWIGIAAVLGVLIWLRFPRLRWPLVVLVLVMAIAGVLFPAIYNFAGGDTEWEVSGGSRLVLIERVLDVAMRNPITGLGPAGYRPYANATPLSYFGATWLAPSISAHNNYVDLFAHGGILGLALFGWFVIELIRMGTRLRVRYTEGFAAAYLNGMLAAGVGALVIMLFADWILPFVYNIGFPGFQASVLIWLFLGGLVSLDNMPQPMTDEQ